MVNVLYEGDKSTLIQIPTGGGKTFIAKHIIMDLINHCNQQVLFVAPKIVLMEQTMEEFKGLKPQIIHGNRKFDKNHHLFISTIQTASRRELNPDVIIVDEIHYGFDGKMVEKIIKDKPNTRVIGLSATPYDKNGKQLKGFELTLDKYDMKYMVENNYLVDIKPYVLTKIRKLDDIQITAGDYNLKELGKIVCDNQTILEIVKSTAEYIKKYKKTIVFAVDINHAELLTKAYIQDGFTAKALHSKLSKDDIKHEIRLFKEDQTKILVSVLMLTTGFDVPDVEVAVIARPTKSQNLYKQMVGRVLRLAPNKTHAVLLDCGNVIENLGMPLEPIKVVQTKEFVINTQKCEECMSENIKLKFANNKSFWECEECGHIKNIEQGRYECKLCNRFYTHDAKFLNKNNKLWLECEDCLYPTLISEYTGSEKFIQVDNKKSIRKALEDKKRKTEEQALKQSKQKTKQDLTQIRATMVSHEKSRKKLFSECLRALKSYSAPKEGQIALNEIAYSIEADKVYIKKLKQVIHLAGVSINTKLFINADKLNWYNVEKALKLMEHLKEHYEPDITKVKNKLNKLRKKDSEMVTIEAKRVYNKAYETLLKEYYREYKLEDE